MVIRCVVCGKQALNEDVSTNDPYVTTLIGAKCGFNSEECY